MLFGYALVLAASAGVLVPVRGQVTDYREFFYRNFRWFFGLQLLASIIDIGEVVVKASTGLRPIPWEYYPAASVFILLYVVAISTRNEKLHAVLAVVMCLSQVWFNTLMSIFAPI